MTERSARFDLPFILPGQAQKELFHNEALAMLDGLVHPAIEGVTAIPPADPVPGESWLVAAAGAGAWSGHDDDLAIASGDGWRFVVPATGMSVWDKSAGFARRWTGNGWSDGTLPAARIEIRGEQVVGLRQPDVPTPSGGTTIDAEARVAIGALIVTLKSHGLID